MAKQIFIFCIIIYYFFFTNVKCVHIEFFKNRNFTGLNYESNSTATCNNVPDDKKDVWIHSIKTDTCLMVYYFPNCQSESRKYNLENSFNWSYPVKSFHTCNDKIGGHQLDIDITKHYELDKPTEIPDVLESYKHVCKCINIPSYIQNMSKWSVNNYGNDLLAYFEPNCSEKKLKPRHIPAGHWGWREGGSRDMYFLVQNDTSTNTIHKVVSIGPDPNAEYYNISCSHQKKNHTLESVVIQLNKQEHEVIKKVKRLEEERVSLAAKVSKLEHEQKNLSQKFVELQGRVEDIESQYKTQKE